MSDRVAIIGGSTVGRDHFSFPVTDRASVISPPIEYFPISLSLSGAALWYWLVKKWHVTGSATLDVETDVYEWDGSGLVTNTYTGSVEWDFNGYIEVYLPTSSLASRESDLVLGIGMRTASGLVTSDGVVWNDSMVTPAGGEDSIVNLLDQEFGQAMTFESGMLWPLLYVQFLLTGQCRPPNLGPFAGVYSGGNEAIALPTGTKAFAAAYAGSLISPGGVVMNGTSVPTYCNPTHDDPSDVTTRIDVSNPVVSIVITPSDYWPYATKAGLPVYDTVTGAQLRDPFS